MINSWFTGLADFKENAVHAHLRPHLCCSVSLNLSLILSLLQTQTRTDTHELTHQQKESKTSSSASVFNGTKLVQLSKKVSDKRQNLIGY